VRVVSIGDINVDIILRSGFPPRGKQVVVDDYKVYGGGCATNFALACARLGVKTKLIGRIGDDYWGKSLLKKLRENGVNTADVVISKDTKTGVTYAIVDEEERSFISYRGGNAHLSITDIPLEKIQADVVHIPSFFLLQSLRPHYQKLMKHAKSGGALVSFDTGWDPFNRWRKTKYLFDALRNANVFLPNLDEARMITGKLAASPKELAERLLKMGPEIVCVKLGKNGSVVADHGGTRKIQPFTVEVIDSTGAGDVFNAAFMVGYLKTKDIVRSGIFANAAAAISITGPGWAKYPHASEVNGFLRSYGFEPLPL